MKLAIIGASYLQLPLVQKAKDIGHTTYCFAWEDGSICKNIADFFYPISILDKEAILNVCKEIGIDGICSIASDIAVPTVCYVAEHLGLISNRYEDALVATNKYLMRERFREFCVSSPKFQIASEKLQLEEMQFPLIVKPTDRSGSRGVQKVQTVSELHTAIDRAKNESFISEVIIEEYLTGTEVSVEAISWHGKHYILAITDKVTTGKPYFVELEHHQPCNLPSEIQEKIKVQTIKALDALNVTFGASHSEFKITESGDVFVIEVGARMGGDFIGSDLVLLSTGYDFVRAVIDVSLGQFHEPSIGSVAYAGVLFLAKETEYILDYIMHRDKYPQIVAAEQTDTILREIQCSADRSGYIIYQDTKRWE